MKASCSSALKLLDKYFDREATGKERSLVEGHLEGCPACRNALKSMEGIREMIKTPADGALREEDFQWVWQNIQREIRLQQKPSWLETFRSWLNITPLFRKRVWIPVVVTMVLLILAGTPLLFKKTPSFPGPSVVEYVESQTHNVIVYESEKSKITVIWLFEGAETEAKTS